MTLTLFNEVYKCYLTIKERFRRTSFTIDCSYLITEQPSPACACTKHVHMHATVVQAVKACNNNKIQYFKIKQYYIFRKIYVYQKY